MQLSPMSLLHVHDGPRRVRLSYVLEDDGGSRKGLTVAGILPGNKPISFGADPTLARRAKVYHGETVVGILDPHLSGDEEHLGQRESANIALLNSGALTCTFTLRKEIAVDPLFGPRTIFDPIEHNGFRGLEAHLLGEGVVGTMTDVLSYSEWGDRSVYPILRLKRSDGETGSTGSTPRNGAIVLTSSGALIGIVVASFEAGRYYGVAPIRDTLEWHRLRILAERRQNPETPPAADTHESAPPSLPLGIERRLRKLMTV